MFIYIVCEYCPFKIRWNARGRFIYLLIGIQVQLVFYTRHRVKITINLSVGGTYKKSQVFKTPVVNVDRNKY